MDLDALEPVVTSWKKLLNRWKQVVGSITKHIPAPISDTTKKIFSQENKGQLLSSIDTVKDTFSWLFSSLKEEHTINIAPEDLVCAVVANISYDDPFARPRQIYSYKLVEDHNNIEHCMYRDEKQQKLVVWFRWTEATEAKDYISDVNILLGTEVFNERFQESIHIYDGIVREYPDDIKVITGHSLGGSICYMLAQLKNPDRTVVFNPWSSANATFVRMFKDTEEKADRTRRVFTYKILGDIVSTLSVVWYTRIFRKATLHPGQLHAIANFMPVWWEEETKKYLEDHKQSEKSWEDPRSTAKVELEEAPSKEAKNVMGENSTRTAKKKTEGDTKKRKGTTSKTKKSIAK